MDLKKFIVDFQDHLAPKLDTYEQAIYLYIFRHSRLIGLDTEHTGRLIRLFLPHEIPGMIPQEKEKAKINIEDMDFFEVPENRLLILEREKHRCFYTLVKLDEKNFVIDHVVSRPDGNNSYRNVVAASREANNKKGQMPAEDFIRKLYREGYLNQTEFDERVLHLQRLRAGELKPPIKNG